MSYLTMWSVPGPDRSDLILGWLSVLFPMLPMHLPIHHCSLTLLSLTPALRNHVVKVLIVRTGCCLIHRVPMEFCTAARHTLLYLCSPRLRLQRLLRVLLRLLPLRRLLRTLLRPCLLLLLLLRSAIEDEPLQCRIVVRVRCKEHQVLVQL